MHELIKGAIALLEEFGFELLEREGRIIAERGSDEELIAVDVWVNARAATYSVRGFGWGIAGVLGLPELRRVLATHIPRAHLQLVEVAHG